MPPPAATPGPRLALNVTFRDGVRVSPKGGGARPTRVSAGDPSFRGGRIEIHDDHVVLASLDIDMTTGELFTAYVPMSNVVYWEPLSAKMREKLYGGGKVEAAAE